MLPIKPDTGNVPSLFPSDLVAQSSVYTEDNSVRVIRIREAASGKGYAFFSDVLEDPSIEGSFEVMDFCWKNSKLGKTVQSIFADPKVADDTEIFLSLQTKVNSAVVSSSESKGSYWENDEPGELNFMENHNAYLDGLTEDLQITSEQQPVSALPSEGKSFPETLTPSENPPMAAKHGAKA